MDRLFRRIVIIGAIVTLLAAGALSGTYAKTGEVLLLGRRPQPSGEPLRIVDMLPDSHADDAKELPAHQRSDQGNAPADVESSLVRLRVIDVEQKQKQVPSPSISSRNALADHASHTNRSLIFSDKSGSEAIEPRRVKPKRNNWQLSAAPELIPRDARLSADQPVQPVSPPSVNVNKSAVRAAPPPLSLPATSPAPRRPRKPLVSSVIKTRNAHDDAARAVKTAQRPKANRTKQVATSVPKAPGATVTRSTVPRNQDVTSTIAQKNPTHQRPQSAAQIKPTGGKPPLVEPDFSTGKPLLAARADQPDRIPIKQLVPPQTARKPTVSRTEKQPQKPAQRVVSKPPRQIPAISKQRFQLVARISREHIGYGMDLAARGATRSARQEFIEVLNRVSQALDHTTGNHQYSQALKAGLTALREAEDFQTGDRRLSTEVDLQHLVATHQTTALKDSGAVQQLTPVMAMQKYLEFAKERLVFASGRQPVASGALYGLARLETLQPQGRPLDRPIRGPRAIALHQAALMVDKGNYAAANELGVLLARYGQLDSAGDILSHAAKVSSVPETWHNLARVYELKGAGQEAAHARAMYHRLRADTRKADVSKNESRQVYWVAPETFGDERLSVAADAPQSPVLHEPSKTSQGSGHTPGWSKPQATTLNGKSGRGKPGTGPLHHLGRLMRGKRDTRNNAK